MHRIKNNYGFVLINVTVVVKSKYASFDNELTACETAERNQCQGKDVISLFTTSIVLCIVL